MPSQALRVNGNSPTLMDPIALAYFGHLAAQFGTERRMYRCLEAIGREHSAMRDYRAYILGIDGHRFVKVKEFLSDQPDDATALSAAKQLADGHEVELWDCGRLVARLSPDGEVTSPELAPFMVSAALSESGSNSSKPAVETISLGRVSELARAPPNENHLLLGW
jgi:hypothetical protein